MAAYAKWYGFMISGANESNPPPRTGLFILYSHIHLFILFMYCVMYNNTFMLISITIILRLFSNCLKMLCNQILNIFDS